DRAGDELLAGAALALYEDGGRGGAGDLLHAPEDVLDGAARPEHRGEAEVAELAAQALDLLAERAALEGVADGGEDALHGEGLLDEVVGAGAHGVDGDRDGRVA